MTGPRSSEMQVQSRRRTLAQMVTALGVLMLSGSLLRHVLPRSTSRAASRNRTTAARRVQPAPHTVKRHG